MRIEMALARAAYPGVIGHSDPVGLIQFNGPAHDLACILGEGGNREAGGQWQNQPHIRINGTGTRWVPGATVKGMATRHLLNVSGGPAVLPLYMHMPYMHMPVREAAVRRN